MLAGLPVMHRASLHAITSKLSALNSARDGQRSRPLAHTGAHWRQRTLCEGLLQVCFCIRVVCCQEHARRGVPARHVHQAVQVLPVLVQGDDVMRAAVPALLQAGTSGCQTCDARVCVCNAARL